MERLRDQRDSNDPTVARAANLLDSARPLEKTALPPPAQKPVLLGVGVRRLVLRPAFLFLGLLATSAAAATAIWVVVEHVAEEEAVIEAPAPAPERLRPRVRSDRSRTPNIPALPQVEGATEVVPGTPPEMVPGTQIEPGAVNDLPVVEPPTPARGRSGNQDMESGDADEPNAPIVRRAGSAPAPARPKVVVPRSEDDAEEENPSDREARPTPGALAAGRSTRPAAAPRLAEPVPRARRDAHQAPFVALPPPPDPEARLLLAAARALRRRSDPRAALRRLEAYLVRFPDGVLVEEAMGLAIEAAAALGSTRAARLGAAYLDRFPQGRFRDAAQRALQRFQPPK